MASPSEPHPAVSPPRTRGSRSPKSATETNILNASALAGLLDPRFRGDDNEQLRGALHRVSHRRHLDVEIAVPVKFSASRTLPQRTANRLREWPTCSSRGRLPLA